MVRDDEDRSGSTSPPSISGADSFSPPRAVSLASPTLRARNDGWTAVRQAVFLAALGDGAAVATAADAAGMSRESAYRLRRNPRAADFAARWAAIDAMDKFGPDLAALLDGDNRDTSRITPGAWLDARAMRPRFNDWLVHRLTALENRCRKA
ncbi:MAG: hypothetical protein ACRYG4_04940 [Janthinobacterium lividum]